ncbi:YheC/YheD family protein [Alicyclobacillus cycloheptanicus]|uniref:YheC/D like ATP-grasp n=1 Tax=Alicyclobacillus cycloheptanicus TaxID=1457 RepID=A0ABT9XHQ2_9BACL|nr:YheC/YheD family protein [Alicyclobacillus cycloheptanicus]MDQ0189303.1 hypothetical protein [Alicyclobacillus cycloheptanicus]WDM01334.1 YheC/YheD family protein [Alicyclobacillus cycloheptanicus]
MRVNVAVDRNLEGAAIALSGIDEAAPSTLAFGDRRTTVARVAAHPRRGRTAAGAGTRGPLLRVSPAVAAELGLARRMPLRVKRDDTSWRLGPCVALYVQAMSDTPRFGEQTPMFKDLSRLARKMGVDLVVIEPGFLRRRRGWRYDVQRNRWQLASLPTPDLVLRRSGSFSRQVKRVAEAELDWFARHGRLHTLSAQDTNKYAFYNLLHSVSELKDYPPYTTVARHVRDVFEAVRKRRDVYVKPFGGARGASVLRLVASSRGVTAYWQTGAAPKGKRSGAPSKPGGASVRLRERQVPSVHSESLSTYAAFQQFWARTKLKECLVQDTVQLARTAQGEPFDLRWLVQVVEDTPTVVARVARVAKRQAVTTNIHTGGRAVDAPHTLRAVFGADKAKKLIAALDDIALRVAAELQKRYGPFAEVGIDLGVDQQGRIVLFEVNPTPGRRMLRELSAGLRELSLTYLLEYAMRATGFAGKVD